MMDSSTLLSVLIMTLAAVAFLVIPKLGVHHDLQRQFVLRIDVPRAVVSKQAAADAPVDVPVSGVEPAAETQALSISAPVRAEVRAEPPAEVPTEMATEVAATGPPTGRATEGEGDTGLTDRAAAAAEQPLFRAVGLEKSYTTPEGTVVVLDRASFEIPRGVTGIVGASGTGKSTLFNMLGALDVPTKGCLWFQGEAIWPASRRTLARHRQSNVAWVFQDLHLPEHLRVRDVVAQPAIMNGVPRRTALARAEEFLAKVGLAEFGRRRPWQLSRGQKQRVAIARAFASLAPVILADEPTGSLDRQTADGVFSLFLELARTCGRSVVLVTHDPRLAQQCDRVFCCHEGKLIARAARAPKSKKRRPELFTQVRRDQSVLAKNTTSLSHKGP
jgi:ABC-type lipoprotein export system ATPase subunit